MGVFSSKVSFNPDTDIGDLTGKVALVTGGNSGIGYHTVKELALHGAKVYLGARNEGRAKDALARLESEGVGLGGKGEVIWLPLDLTTPSTTKAGADEFLRRESRLDILVNNAAALNTTSSFAHVEARIPMTLMMSVNHLGPFVLTNAVLPLMKKVAAETGSDVRIINVASNAEMLSPKDMDWKDVKRWNFQPGSYLHQFRAYGTSKLANIFFTQELQRRLDEEGVDVLSICLDPGFVRSEGHVTAVGRASFIPRLFFTLALPLGSTPAQGARNTLFAATSPDIKSNKQIYGGKYLFPIGVVTEPKSDTRDPQVARQLWEVSERVVQDM